MATAGADDQNFGRLLIMVMKGGTKMARYYFEKRVQDLKPSTHDPNTPWTVDDFLLQNKTEILKYNKGREKEDLYFPDDGDTADLDSWDLSMFCFILPKVCKLTDSMLRDIDDLKEMRNNLCHMGNRDLEDSKYTTEVRNFKVIATNICKEIDNDTLQQDINRCIREAEIGPFPYPEVMREMRLMYTMDREIKTTLNKQTKDIEKLLNKTDEYGRKMDIVHEKLCGGPSVKLPGTDVEILVLNCNKEKENKMSKILVDMFDEEINKTTELAKELTNPTMIKLREAVTKTFEIFLANGRTITSAENECVLLRIHCATVTNLVKLFRDCISGELNNQLKPLENAVRGFKGFNRVDLEVVIYEDEFWKVMRKTAAAVDEYLKALENYPKPIVTMASAQENQGTVIKFSIKYRSPSHRSALREAIQTREVEKRINTIQDAIGLEYPNVTVKLLKPKDELSPKEFYSTAKKIPKKVKSRKKIKKGKDSESWSDQPKSRSNALVPENETAVITKPSTDENDSINDLGISSCHQTESDTDTSQAKAIVNSKQTLEMGISTHPHSESWSDQRKYRFTSLVPENEKLVVLSAFSTDENDSGIYSNMSSCHQTKPDTYTDTSEVKDIDFKEPSENDSNASEFEQNEEAENYTDYDVKSCVFRPESDNSISIEHEMKDYELLKNGIKLNDSFLAELKSKSSKHAPFYEQFLDDQKLAQLLNRHPTKFVRGILYLQGSHEAICKPNHPQQSFEVHISGRSKIGQAYNQDEVVVELLDKKQKSDIRFGKVVGILQRQKKIKHPVFLCTPDDVESHIVCPMCKTVPKIHVIQDKLKQTRKNPKARKNLIEIYEYHEEAEILGDSRVEELLPNQINSCVFLVALISWEINQVYPRGAIIKRFPLGDTIGSGIAILNLRYGILPPSEAAENNDGIPSDHPENREEIRTDKTYLNSFTIDRNLCKDLNYAFSVESKENGFIVGVHVIDVAVYVTKESPIDKITQMRSQTICSDIGKPAYMFPEEIAERLCSLRENEKRPTISFFFFLNESGGLMQTEGKTFYKEKTFITCRKNFSYLEAMQARNSDDALSSSLNTIFKLMTHRRKQRLGASKFVLSEYEINRENMEKDSLVAQCVVEELIIMVNEQVAKMLDKNKNICLPLFTENKPSEKDLQGFLEKFGDYLNVVVSLQHKIIGNRVNFEEALKTNSALEIFETRDAWESMQLQADTACRSLLDDNIHPLQCVIYQKWLAIRQTPCYRNSKSTHVKENFNLGLQKYTHCTLPSRRFIDLVVQRLIHADIENKPCPYSEQEIENICIQATSSLRKTSDYNRDLRSLTTAVTLKRKAQLLTCFVKEVSDKNVTFIDTSDYSSLKNELDVPFNLLDMCYKPDVFEDRNTKWMRVKGKWRKRYYDFTKYVPVTEHGSHPTKSKTFTHGNQKLESENRVEVLDHNRNVVFVKLHQYAGLIKSASDDHVQDLKRKLKRTDAKTRREGKENISTELTDRAEILANTIFSHTFFIGQPVTLQLSAEPYQGILRPKPMVFQMTKTINMCLLHTEDPVLHLSRYETRSAQDRYENVQHYSDTWLPIVMMEASVDAINNDDSCSIDNIEVTCETDKDGAFQLPIDFCEERNIKFSGTVFKTDCDEDDSKHSFDWLCIKYLLSGMKAEAVDASIWIGHARITEIIERHGGTFSITFKLHERTDKFPTEMLQQRRASVSIELLRKTDVDRRIESYLRRFRETEDEKEPLSVKIAVQRKCHALDGAHRKIAEIIERDLYFSVTSDDPRRRPLPRNNQKQQEAINLALRNRFTLIQGPPGTGKTYTGIKLIYLFNKINNILSKEENIRKQVLFCGPSNKSVDLVAKWMLFRLGNYCPDFVRVYGKATETLDFPIPGAPYSSRESGVHQADKELQDVSLHFLIRRRGNRYAKEINEIDDFFKSFQEKSTYKRKTLNKTIREYKKLVNTASKEEIKKHRVILCTTGVGSNPVILEAVDIYQVIVDEAGMCSEPQCMVPIIATKAQQVVLIGDHKQLRPIVKCKAAAELGLDKSLFERYATMKSSPTPFIMLDEQYRMNPALCEFPSKQFYDGKLQTMRGQWEKGEIMQIWPKDSNTDQPYPHVFIHIEGEEQILTVHTDDGNEQSRSNYKEIKKVLQVYRYFIEDGVDAKSINIISQYNAQRAAIEKELKTQGFQNYIVNTVVSSQGGEWDYVIFSTVRSLPEYKIEVNSTLGWRKHNLGFITDKNQINVALTRARKGLMIIGNKNLLSCDPVWKRLVGHYEQRKCVKLPHEFPPPPRSRQQKLRDAQERSKQLYGQDYEDCDDEKF